MVGNRNLSVGIFVSVALALLIGFTIWVTGKRGDQEVTHYSVLFENDVTGLMMGGPVFFLGVRVGEVTDMTIMDGNPPSIRVDIQVLESAPVDQGTWATLAPQGITGVSIINLSSDTGDYGKIETTSGHEFPLIPYRDSGFSAIISSAPRLINKIEVLLDEATLVFSEDNRTAFTNTLTHIESLTSSLAAEDSAFASLPGSINSLIAELRGTARSLQVVIDEAGPATANTVANLEQTTRQLSEITATLQGWLTENESEIEHFMGEGLGQVPELINETRQAIQQLEQLVRKIRETPSSIIYKQEREAIPVEE